MDDASQARLKNKGASRRRLVSSVGLPPINRLENHIQTAPPTPFDFMQFGPIDIQPADDAPGTVERSTFNVPSLRAPPPEHVVRAAQFLDWIALIDTAEPARFFRVVPPR